MNQSVSPTMGDALGVFERSLRAGLVVSRTAVVDAYDRTAGTVDVTLCAQTPRPVRGGVQWESAPQLRGVRVQWPSGGGAVITFPIAVGDLVTLIVRDVSHAEVDEGVDVYPATPKASRRFSLSDVVALPGYSTDRDPLPSGASSATDVVIYMPNGVELRIGGGTASKAIALAEKCAERVARIEAFLNTATYSTPAGPTVAPAPPPFAGSVTGPVCTASVVVGAGAGTVTADLASTRAFVDD